MKVYSIDPGTQSLGWAILNEVDNEVDLIDYGVIQFDGSESLLNRLNKIYIDFFRVLSDHSDVDLLMLEKTWRVDRGSVALVAAIKVIKETAELVEGLKIRQANAMSVRKEFGCGARDSETAKGRTRAWVVENFGIDGSLPSDIYDAILLAMYGIQTS